MEGHVYLIGELIFVWFKSRHIFFCHVYSVFGWLAISLVTFGKSKHACANCPANSQNYCLACRTVLRITSAIIKWEVARIREPASMISILGNRADHSLLRNRLFWRLNKTSFKVSHWSNAYTTCTVHCQRSWSLWQSTETNLVIYFTHFKSPVDFTGLNVFRRRLNIVIDAGFSRIGCR
jgi:hypothetical protein